MTAIPRRTVLAASAAATALIAVPYRRARAESAAPSGHVRVGVLTDEAGPYAASGGPGSITAAEMAAHAFGPTVLGQPIEIIHADTRNKPDVASSIAREWYDQGVDAITDLPVTPVAAAVLQVARQKTRTIMITASAITEFTSKLCAPISSHWADDTHALAAGSSQVLTKAGGTTWYFITVDFSFGAGLQTEASKVIAANGGKVLGTAKFPLGNTDFSSQIVQAQASGAKVIGLIAVGQDQVNLIKQAAEFGLQQRGGQTLAAFLVYITDIQALGLRAAQGLRFPNNYYWDHSDGTRVFAEAFFKQRQAMPTKNQAAIYASTLHFLKSMAKAGTRDPLAVNKAMRAMPVDWFGDQVQLRGDGRLMTPPTLYRVKAPNESKRPWDDLAAVGTIPASAAFYPALAACETT